MAKREQQSMPLKRELIPEARYCSEVGRTPWILLQLVPEGHNVIVDATGGRIAVSITTNFQ
jgi:hypothetical protein